MNLSEQRSERDRTLASILLERFRHDVGDISLTELFGLFQAEDVSGDARFWTYEAFVLWMKKHPELTVGLVDGPRRGTLVVEMDSRAARFTETLTGETIWTGEFRPFGDFSYCLDTEVAP